MITSSEIEPTQEVKQAVAQFKVAQNIGRVASKLEQDAFELRRTVDELNLTPLHAPEGQVFNIAVNSHECALVIEPFIHSRCDWGDQYRPSDDEYNSLVKKSSYGDDANINVDILEYSSGETKIWGYNSQRRVRVLIDHTVKVKLTAEADTPIDE